MHDYVADNCICNFSIKSVKYYKLIKKHLDIVDGNGYKFYVKSLPRNNHILLQKTSPSANKKINKINKITIYNFSYSARVGVNPFKFNSGSNLETSRMRATSVQLHNCRHIQLSLYRLGISF